MSVLLNSLVKCQFEGFSSVNSLAPGWGLKIKPVGHLDSLVWLRRNAAFSESGISFVIGG